MRVIYFFYPSPPVVYLLTAYAKAEREGLKPARSADVDATRGHDQEGGQMTEERTAVGREVEEALKEVLAHVRGEVALATRIVDDPSKVRILAVRKKLGLSRRRFAERYHLDPRTVQDWEQGRRTPDQAARVLLTVIEREPEAVERALTSAG